MTVAPAFAAGGDPVTSGRGESQLRARLRALRGDATRIESADEVLSLLDGGRLRRAGGLADLVDRASERAVRAGVDRVIQMPPPLCDMLPGRGLRRGSTVAVRGSASMLFAMLAAATRAGCWCAVVGMPNLGLVAADELNVDLERLALVPNPGPDWPEVVAALLDGIDLVVVGAPTATAPVPARGLSARARQRGSVLVGVGEWPRAELTIGADHGVWHGLESGRGRLRCRSLTVTVSGRGAAGRACQARMWLPALTGPLPMIAGQVVVESGTTDPAAVVAVGA